MSIDIFSETLLSLADAAKSLPGRPHISTLFRWRRVGVRGIQLETCRIGGKRMTSREALGRFFAAINASEAQQTVDAPEAQPTVSKSRSRRRAVEQAERQLEKAGIRKTGPTGGETPKA